MKLYLDIDGVLLTVKNTEPAYYVDEFIEFITDNFDCYWLTSHCKGDAQTALGYLSPFLCESSINLLKRVKETNWDVLKTDGIDFNSNFVWIDDYVMAAEKLVLKNHNSEDKLLLVNLREKSLLDVMDELFALLKILIKRVSMLF